METSGSHMALEVEGTLSLAEKARFGLDIDSFRKRMESRFNRVCILKGDMEAEAEVETPKAAKENNCRS